MFPDRRAGRPRTALDADADAETSSGPRSGSSVMDVDAEPVGSSVSKLPERLSADE